MKRPKIIITIIFVIVTASASFALALAQTSTHPPGFPSSFYGVVDDQTVTENSMVTVWINGQLITSSKVKTFGADLVYSLRIPADDPSTTGVIEGGKEGDLLMFTIDELPAHHSDNNTWHGGTNIRLDLTLTEPVLNEKIYLPLIVK
ncbi:MAG: hypothetical protein MUO40_07585 [Anaerolineaceae bacterium]|nr:hypothetical protein [Anaerolineaceae bacterium]